MSRAGLLLVLTLSVVAGGCAGAQKPGSWFPGENLVVPMPVPRGPWQEETFVRKEGAGNRMIRWSAKGSSDQFQVWFFYGQTSVDPLVFKQGEDQEARTKICVSFEAAAPEAALEAGYQTLTSLTVCKNRDGGKTRVLEKIIAGRDTLYVLKRAWRGEVAEDDLTFWREYLASVKLCDTRSATSPCPSDFVRE